MKSLSIVLSFVSICVVGRAATIDRMTFNPWTGGNYSPSKLSLPAPADTYFLSDGSSWQSGAGTWYTISTTFVTSVVSDGFVYYHFAPLANSILYRQTDYDAGTHSAQGTLTWTGDVVLAAEIGSTEATFSGYATILDNNVAQYARPGEFNYYSASVGQSVYFQMDFTINNATWQPDSFTMPLNYSADGYVDFTQVVPEPNSSVFFVLSIGSILICRRLSVSKSPRLQFS